MKIGIISFFNNSNSGSNLQALALQTVIGRDGNFSCHIKITRTKVQKVLQCIEDMLEIIKHPSYIYWIIPLLKMRFIKKKNQSVIQEEYGLNYLYLTVDRLNEDEFDAYIIGSDQIWSPLKFPFEKSVFLPKVRAEKKMAYAVSFGVDKMPKFNKNRIKRQIKKFKYLSFREIPSIEDDSMKLEKCKEVLDPTLLLSSEEWDGLIEIFVSRKIEYDNFALMYFLDVPTEKQLETISLFCNRLKINKAICIGKKIINTTDNILFFEGVQNLDFIDIIKKSCFVFTDSYHGTIFSIIYNKKLAIFERNNLNIAKQFNRIHNLAYKLNFEDLIVKEDNVETSLQNIVLFNYRKTNECILKQRELSKKFLYDTIKKMGDNY